MQQMVLALKTKDMDKFFNYLDLKEIFNNFLTASSRENEPPNDQQVDEWTKYSRQLGRNFAHLVLPKLFETFQTQIREVLQSYLLNLDNTRIMAIAAAVTVARIDIQGDEATVTLVDPKTQEPFRFQMRRQPDRRVWRIVSVNYDDLKKLCKREFRPRK
jgi:hypothetical protein